MSHLHLTLPMFSRLFALLVVTLLATRPLTAQTFTFDTQDFTSFSVYDADPQSPFRTGVLKGHVALADNPQMGVDSVLGFAPNPTPRVLALQRSRWGSALFGVRIDLPQPLRVPAEGLNVHALVYKPKAGRTMLIGLGKRSDLVGEPTDVEQFWVLSQQPVTPHQWEDAVFTCHTAPGVEIHSLVLVPDAESTHHLKADFAAFVDQIAVMPTASPRFQRPLSIQSILPAETPDQVTITDSQRNGDVLDAEGRPLGFLIAYGRPFTVKLRPENGFAHDGLRVRHGYALDGEPVVGGQTVWREERVPRSAVSPDGLFTIPSEWVDGNIRVEGIFVSINHPK